MPQVKLSNPQIRFGGGMNHDQEADQLLDDECLLARGYRIRNGNMETSKGAVLLTITPPSSEYHHWIYTQSSTTLPVNKFKEIKNTFPANDFLFTDGKSPCASGAVAIQQAANANERGVIFLNEGFDWIPGSGFDLSVQIVGGTVGEGFLTLQSSRTALTAGVGLEVEWRFADKSIRIREDGVEVHNFGTDLWITSNLGFVRTRFVRLENGGWKVNIKSNSHPTALAGTDIFEGEFTTTFKGVDNPVVALNPTANAMGWLAPFYIRNGWGWASNEITSTDTNEVLGLTRFYREGASPKLIAAQGGGIYEKVDFTWRQIANNMDPRARVRFEVFRNTLIASDGKHNPKMWNGMGLMQPLGAGQTAAPHAKFIRAHLERLFAIGDENNPNTLFYSSFIDASLWDKLLNFIQIDEWQGDASTGLEVLGGNLFIFKENSIWKLAGRTPEQFTLMRVPNVPGCIAPDSIANTGREIFYLANDGVYVFNGVQSQEVSRKVRPIFKGTSEYLNAVPSHLKDSVGIYHDFAYRLSIHAWDIHEQPSVAYPINSRLASADFNKEVVGIPDDIFKESLIFQKVQGIPRAIDTEYNFERYNAYRGFRNVELILDLKSFPQSGEPGGWSYNPYPITAYAVQSGNKDQNELIAGWSVMGFVAELEKQYGRWMTNPVLHDDENFAAVESENESRDIIPSYQPENNDILNLRIWCQVQPELCSQFYLSKHFAGSDPLVQKDWQRSNIFYRGGNDGLMTFRWHTNKHHGLKFDKENKGYFRFRMSQQDQQERLVDWQKGRNSLDNSYLLGSDELDTVTIEDDRMLRNVLGSPNQVSKQIVNHRFTTADGEFFFFSLYTARCRQPIMIRAVQVEFNEHFPNVVGETNA